MALALLDKGGSRKGCGNKSILVRIGSYRWPRCADHVVHNVVVRVGLAGGGGLDTIMCCSASKPIREAKCCCGQAPSPCGGRGVLARLRWLRGASGPLRSGDGSKEARCRGGATVESSGPRVSTATPSAWHWVWKMVSEASFHGWRQVGQGSTTRCAAHPTCREWWQWGHLRRAVGPVLALWMPMRQMGHDSSSVCAGGHWLLAWRKWGGVVGAGWTGKGAVGGGAEGGSAAASLLWMTGALFESSSSLGEVRSTAVRRLVPC